MTPKPKAAIENDPQPVFDALDAYIAGTSWMSANASVNLDGSGASHTMTCQDQKGNSFSYTERETGIRVSVTPPSASLGPGQTQQFNAKATNPDGSVVTGATYVWALNAGALGTVDATGKYAAPATVAAAASDALTCTLQGHTPSAWSTVTIALHP
jgi:hypothetical protein